MRRPALALVAIISAAIVASSPAQDIAPDPADAEAVKHLLKKATQAILEKDAKTFASCCEVYVDCFFYDGTRVKGTRGTERALADYFARRPEGVVIKPDVIPRSYRVLSPNIMMVDWPATIQGPDGDRKVNTLTVVSKVDGKWSIAVFLESVSYTPSSRAPSPGSIDRRGH